MIGKTIYNYKILEKLDEGGIGVVYKAEDTKPKHTAVIKTHLNKIPEEPSFCYLSIRFSISSIVTGVPFDSIS